MNPQKSPPNSKKLSSRLKEQIEHAFHNRVYMKKFIQLKDPFNFDKLLNFVHLFAEVRLSALDRLPCFTPEHNMSRFVSSFLNAVIYSLKQCDELPNARYLRLSAEASAGKDGKSSVDYMIQFDDQFDDQSVKDLIFIEVRGGDPEYAVDHCLEALINMRKKTKRQKVYGLCTSAERWLVVEWDGKNLVISYWIQLFGSSGNPKAWLKENAVILIKMILSLLIPLLGNPSIGHSTRLPQQIHSTASSKKAKVVSVEQSVAPTTSRLQSSSLDRRQPTKPTKTRKGGTVAKRKKAVIKKKKAVVNKKKAVVNKKPAAGTSKVNTEKPASKASKRSAKSSATLSVKTRTAKTAALQKVMKKK